MSRPSRALLLLLALAAACGGAGASVGELEAAARKVVEALDARDPARLAELVHPEDGVLVSPYAHVEPESHVTLTAGDLRRAAEGAAIERDWGHFDGSGEPIRLTFREYFGRFVYDAPYLEKGEVAVDRRQGGGNTVDNAAEVWPGARIVEYHVPGTDPRYGGMDWRSLRLVFEEEDGRWWLVGIVHDEWTI
jgi:hypothetical protein